MWGVVGGAKKGAGERSGPVGQGALMLLDCTSMHRLQGASGTDQCHLVGDRAVVRGMACKARTPAPENNSAHLFSHEQPCLQMLLQQAGEGPWGNLHSQQGNACRPAALPHNAHQTL